ncbi:MAG: amidohydrolase [Thauera aminoaromatica]|jgi:cytosine/adenosine deaminase-related metal-dependent hydrolase|uniref:Amidohydrolase n=2 Tax=Thauera aminoaromatica TaxID=164330 RepID=A0A5C7SHY1_THASP|nr:MAG: amidohydrolase [Thauera aminoaromatica]
MAKEMRMVLEGKIVTMAGEVIDRGRVFVEGDRIAAVRAQGSPAPAGWDDAKVIDTGGVIYPGLIDLHGHLAYNVLPLWEVPRRYENRSDWMRAGAYKRDITVPMDHLTSQGGPAFARALVRYVEVKLLMGGTTVAQGLRSKSGPGGTLYRGLVRNAEAPDEAGMLRAGTRVPDLQLDQVGQMRASLDSGDPYFFHLAEGVDEKARNQFRLLQDENLLRDNLICIHCVGLGAADHQTLRQSATHTVWSPFSNLLLYGATLDKEALAGDFALGCDWSPSGSRNLLHEMKVASLHAQAAGWNLSHEMLARSVTVNAAAALQWDEHVGRIAEGMLADLLVLDSNQVDPFENLVRATERDVRLVIIDGHPRYGDRGVMDTAASVQNLEFLGVGLRPKALDLHQPESPLQGIGLQAAMDFLRSAMSDLTKPPPPPLFPMMNALADEEFSVELDMQGEVEDFPLAMAAAEPRRSIPLDPLTVVDDPDYFDRLDEQPNLPQDFKGPEGLRAFYH